MGDCIQKLTYPTLLFTIEQRICFRGRRDLVQIISVRHDWPEREGFHIHRPNGRKDYTFLHFITPIDFEMDGKVIHGRPGACIFFSPGTPQHFFATEPVIHNWIHIDASLGTLLEHYGIVADRLEYPANPDFISRLFHMLEVEYFTDNAYGQELMEGYVREFLIRYARSLETENAVKGISRSDRQKLSSVRQQVLSQPQKRWTVADMAALANLSPSYFHSIYKTLFGTAPIRDLIEAKMRYAKSLLRSYPELKIPEIAECLGYTDQYHFIRLFKSVVGLTPGQYRRENNFFKNSKNNA